MSRDQRESLDERGPHCVAQFHGMKKKIQGYNSSAPPSPDIALYTSAVIRAWTGDCRAWPAMWLSHDGTPVVPGPKAGVESVILLLFHFSNPSIRIPHSGPGKQTIVGPRSKNPAPSPTLDPGLDPLTASTLPPSRALCNQMQNTEPPAPEFSSTVTSVPNAAALVTRLPGLTLIAHLIVAKSANPTPRIQPTAAVDRDQSPVPCSHPHAVAGIACGLQTSFVGRSSCPAVQLQEVCPACLAFFDPRGEDGEGPDGASVVERGPWPGCARAICKFARLRVATAFARPPSSCSCFLQPYKTRETR